MKCEACGLEKEQGDNYIVRYGTPSGSVSAMGGKVVTKFYHIDGMENVFICDACLERRFDRLMLFVAGGLMLIAIIYGTVALIAHQSTGDVLPTCAFFALLSLLLYFGTRRTLKKGKNSLKNRLMFGDLYAIRLKKPELRRRGYKNYFRRDE